MQVEKQSANTFLLKTGGSSYKLVLSIKDKKIIFLMREEDKELKEVNPPYQGAYTLGALIDLDQRFRGYFKVEELLQDIQTSLEKNLVNLEKKDLQLILSFATIGPNICIPIKELAKGAENALLEDKKNDLKVSEGADKNLIEEITIKDKRIHELEKELEDFKRLSIKSNLTNMTTITPQKLQQKDILNESMMDKPITEMISNRVQQLKEVFERNIRSNETNKTRKFTALFDPLKVKLKTVINEHTNSVTSLCVLSDGRLASCSSDKSIKVYNKETYECELTIKGHTEGVVYISLLANGYLASSSLKEIKIWEITKDTYQCIQTLAGHGGWVKKVIQLKDNRIASCSNDKTIKIWKYNSMYECIKTLKEHTNAVFSIIELKNKKSFVSGGGDKTLRFWNNETYECEKVIEGVWCCNSKSLIEIESGRLVVGGSSGKVITIVNSNNYTVEKQIEESSLAFVYSLIELDDGTVLLGCKNGENEGSLVNVDIKNGKVLKIKDDAHSRYIFGLLKINKNIIITCSQDHSIKIWNI